MTPLAAPKTCAFCNLPHMDPCASTDDTAKCPIYQAQHPLKGPMTDTNSQPTMTITAPVQPVQAAPVVPQVVADILTQAAPVAAPTPSVTEIIAQTPAPAAAPQAQNPAHYNRFKIQPIVFIRENQLPFWSANVVKYVCREDAKDGVTDIEKAIEYLLKERAYLKGDPDWMLATLKQ